MRQLILKISMTLDGFVCGPNGELDWFLKTRSEDGAAWVASKISQASAHLMGRKTFENMIEFWPNSGGDLAKAMNEIPKIAFSKKGFTPTEKKTATDTPATNPSSMKTWLDAKVFTGDLATEIQNLKNQDGKPLIAHGGASFAQSLVETGLIDELCLVVHPVALGKGRGLFSEIKKPLYLKLVETKKFSAGTVAHIYKP